MPRDGNGAALAIVNVNTALLWTRIAIGDMTAEVLDDSVLATTTYMTKQPGSLKDPPTVDCDYLAALDNASTSDQLVGVHKTGTADFTITFPEETTTGDPKTIVGSGFVSAMSEGELANNELIFGSLTIQFDGQSLTITPETNV